MMPIPMTENVILFRISVQYTEEKKEDVQIKKNLEINWTRPKNEKSNRIW